MHIRCISHEEVFALIPIVNFTEISYKLVRRKLIQTILYVGVYPTSDVEGAGVRFISGGRASTFELAFGLRRPKNTNTWYQNPGTSKSRTTDHRRPRPRPDV
jgi:hypothetical protein